MFQFEVDDDVVADSTALATAVDTDIKVGDNVIVDGRWTGRVGYIGEVQGYSGGWLGIEWEDPSRGKHSGEVGGHQYFNVSVPGAASFVRPAKARKLKGLMNAFHGRYNADDEEGLVGVRSIDDGLERTKISFRNLKVVNLGGQHVRDVRDWEALTSLCPNVQVAELNDNQLTDWISLVNLFKGWTLLKRVDVSRNPLQPLKKEVDVVGVIPKLEAVVLGGLGYDWEAVIRCCQMWPFVVELYVPFNRISSIEHHHLHILMNLTSLDLQKNNISSWKEVLNLQWLPRLEYLNLGSNQITKVELPKDDNNGFSSLLRLNLSENLIDDWSSVNALNVIRNLQELRIDDNPVLTEFDKVANRQILIARLPGLLKLEGVDITRQERRDAELDYVKLYSKQRANLHDDLAFERQNPLFNELAKKYEIGDTADSNVDASKRSLLRLTIVADSGLKKKECERQILPTMTVQKLKKLLQRTFALPQVSIHITATSCRNPEVSFPLDDDFLEVGQYSLEDGDTLLLSW